MSDDDDLFNDFIEFGNGGEPSDFGELKEDMIKKGVPPSFGRSGLRGNHGYAVETSLLNRSVQKMFVLAKEATKAVHRVRMRFETERLVLSYEFGPHVLHSTIPYILTENPSDTPLDIVVDLHDLIAIIRGSETFAAFAVPATPNLIRVSSHGFERPVAVYRGFIGTRDHLIPDRSPIVLSQQLGTLARGLQIVSELSGDAESFEDNVVLSSDGWIRYARPDVFIDVRHKDYLALGPVTLPRQHLRALSAIIASLATAEISCSDSAITFRSDRDVFSTSIGPAKKVTKRRLPPDYRILMPRAPLLKLLQSARSSLADDANVIIELEEEGNTAIGIEANSTGAAISTNVQGRVDRIGSRTANDFPLDPEIPLNWLFAVTRMSDDLNFQFDLIVNEAGIAMRSEQTLNEIEVVTFVGSL